MLTNFLLQEFSMASTSETSGVYSWGLGQYGQLGHGKAADELLPAVIGNNR